MLWSNSGKNMISIFHILKLIDDLTKVCVTFNFARRVAAFQNIRPAKRPESIQVNAARNSSRHGARRQPEKRTAAPAVD